ncbi:MAG: hypothetical protein GY869_17070, partial [Planctomycetes bacterium]|nr:hypothetical protein [Planctomycetota bacterium]
MTMNDHWGWNKSDQEFKSTEDLIRKLIDIASTGGNFLLNIGPKADGTFPVESIERLAGIGKWMDKNADSIYGTTASLFSELDWGRSTTKGNKIYLHVFDWPTDGKLVVPGLLTPVQKAYLLEQPQENLPVQSIQGSVVLTVPSTAPDSIAGVIVMEFETKPEVVKDPHVIGEQKFYLETQVQITSDLTDIQIRYTLDGSDPSGSSNIYN